MTSGEFRAKGLARLVGQLGIVFVNELHQQDVVARVEFQLFNKGPSTSTVDQMQTVSY